MARFQSMTAAGEWRRPAREADIAVRLVRPGRGTVGVQRLEVTTAIHWLDKLEMDTASLVMNARSTAIEAKPGGNPSGCWRGTLPLPTSYATSDTTGSPDQTTARPISDWVRLQVHLRVLIRRHLLLGG
jgi:hypothetical protein